MFLAGQLLTFATQPVAWVIIALALGISLLKTRHAAKGIHLCTGALLLLVFVGWQAPVDALMHHLETQSPPPIPESDFGRYEGIVVLGGAFERAALWRPDRIALKGEAERMIVPVGLLGRHPHLRLLFTGGGDSVKLESLTEADRAKIFFDSLNVDPARLLYEGQSRTTYENALLGAQVKGVDIKKPWLLLTTAAHMPRSLGVFRKVGWNVTPYSVDYRTADSINWLGYSIEGGVQKWHYALHEIIGYAMYRATGRL